MDDDVKQPNRITVWETGAIAPSIMKDAPRDRPILALCEDSPMIERAWLIVRWNETQERWMPRFTVFPVNPVLWLDLPPTED